MKPAEGKVIFLNVRETFEPSEIQAQPAGQTLGGHTETDGKAGMGSNNLQASQAPDHRGTSDIWRQRLKMVELQHAQV